ncbi:hypothetical protein D3C75_185220 [compost metagenome]
MSNYKFSTRSKNNLVGVHPDLVKVAYKALEISKSDFIITEGVRTVERQKQMLREGKSTIMNSAHLTGRAIDIVPFPVSWVRKDFEPVVAAFKEAAGLLGVRIDCGHDWTRFPDSPHIELDRKAYKY